MKRKVFITGASRGIGKALSERLLKDKNTSVTGISRNASLADSNYNHLSIDLSEPSEACKIRLPEYEGEDCIVLVNNAGTLGETKHFGNMHHDDIVKTYNTNLLSPVLLMNKFLKVYLSSPARLIVINISSGAAKSAYDGWGNYCASKAGLDMATKVVKEESRVNNLEDRLFVYSIAPGTVETDMQKKARTSDITQFSNKEKFVMLKETGKLYSAEDVASVLADVIHHPENFKESAFRIVLENG